MATYEQQLWQQQFDSDKRHRRTTKTLAWVLGALVAVGAAAFLSSSYWMPYV